MDIPDPVAKPGDGVTTDPIYILHVPVDRITIAETLNRIRQYVSEPKLHQIATVNPEFIMRANQDRSFKNVLQEADLRLADGVGLILAGRWLGQRLPERVAGSDLVYEIARLSAENGWRLFLLGAAPGVAEKAGAILQEHCPGLIVAGTHPGSPDLAENDDIVRRINESRAEILFVAYGAPKQDKWIARNRESLPTVRVAMGVGGSLDFVTGRSHRAPIWLRRLGLEWLYRLVREPWRWRRMLALPRFAVQVFLSRWWEEEMSEP